MLATSSTSHQTNLFGTDLLQQLDITDPLLKLSAAIPWHEFDEAFSDPLHKSGRRAEQADPFDGWVIDPEAIREFE